MPQEQKINPAGTCFRMFNTCGRFRYTQRRPERTHGGVLNLHTEGFSACQAAPHHTHTPTPHTTNRTHNTATQRTHHTTHHMRTTMSTHTPRTPRTTHCTPTQHITTHTHNNTPQNTPHKTTHSPLLLEPIRDVVLAVPWLLPVAVPVGSPFLS